MLTPIDFHSHPSTQDIEVELGADSVAHQDLELEMEIEQACRQLLLGNRGILGRFLPLVQSVLSRPTHFNHSRLQNAALLALAKFMLCDEVVCSRNLRLLFTLLRHSRDELIRQNCIVALGDLAFRFPNLLEPWNKFMYQALHDPSAGVRKHTMMVITHLVLSDMLKAKGPIAHFSLCLEDKDETLSGLARVFFHEISKRGGARQKNPIYNYLPVGACFDVDSFLLWSFAGM